MPLHAGSSGRSPALEPLYSLLQEVGLVSPVSLPHPGVCCSQEAWFLSHGLVFRKQVPCAGWMWSLLVGPLTGRAGKWVSVAHTSHSSHHTTQHPSHTRSTHHTPFSHHTPHNSCHTSAITQHTASPSVSVVHLSPGAHTDPSSYFPASAGQSLSFLPPPARILTSQNACRK